MAAILKSRPVMVVSKATMAGLIFAVQDVPRQFLLDDGEIGAAG